MRILDDLIDFRCRKMTTIQAYSCKSATSHHFSLLRPAAEALVSAGPIFGAETFSRKFSETVTS